MTTSTRPDAATTGGLGRRSFLGLLAAGAGVVGVPSLLTGCGSPGGAGGAASGGAAAGGADAVIPDYIPVEYARPDFPSVNGSTPGFAALPDELVRSVPSVPGSGATFTAMTPLWGTIPPTRGNRYYAAVNEALGSSVEFRITDGNTYGDKLATVLASPADVADWVCVPSWNIPPRFGSQVVGNVFQDLTPFLAGSKVEDYPNLANIPSDCWRFCVFEGRLYGLPIPGEVISDVVYYRKDVLDGLGITPDVRTAQDLLDLAVELTDPGRGRWGAEDLWTAAAIVHAVPPRWALDDSGALVHRVETEEYRAALDWTARLFASGAVHPDAVAVQTSDAKQRFQGGQSLIMADGIGGWHEALRDNLGSDPGYWQQPLEPFAADGGTPVLYKGNPANILSFLKKTDDDDRVRELLRLADLLAAPFGTTEFDLVTNGVEGVHFSRDDRGLPVPNDLAATELQPTYAFLAAAPMTNSRVQYPGFVEAASTWQARAAEHLVEPLFYGMQIAEPAQYASIGQAFEDLEKDVARGRRTLRDLDAAVATWRSSGGDELRAFYAEILETA